MKLIAYFNVKLHVWKYFMDSLFTVCMHKWYIIKTLNTISLVKVSLMIKSGSVNIKFIC